MVLPKSVITIQIEHPLECYVSRTKNRHGADVFNQVWWIFDVSYFYFKESFYLIKSLK